MKKRYDFVYLTNTPSFYKLNLCNEIAKTNSMLLVFAGYDDKAVNTILSSSTSCNFDFVFLNKGDYESRPSWKVFIRLVSLMKGINAKRIIYSGWIATEYNLFSFISPKHLNALVCESTVNDTNFSGIKGWFKRRIVNRMSAALPTGKLHAQLFKDIDFKGECNITGSVGIFNKGERSHNDIHPKSTAMKYLYIGRLVDVKNLGFLIDVFNQNGKQLTIVGDGVLKDVLKAKADSNITFLGFKDNNALGAIYQSHDCFILPSYSETWGLVVEEALYWGLPVIVSDRVGSSIDMVADLGTGEIFESNNPDSLNESIRKIEKDHTRYLSAVNKINWVERDRNQVNAYLSLLEH